MTILRPRTKWVVRNVTKQSLRPLDVEFIGRVGFDFHGLDSLLTDGYGGGDVVIQNSKDIKYIIKLNAAVIDIAIIITTLAGIRPPPIPAIIYSPSMGGNETTLGRAGRGIQLVGIDSPHPP